MLDLRFSFIVTVSFLVACASSGTPPAAERGEDPEMPVEVEAPASDPDKASATCDPVNLGGTWLLTSGTATWRCGDEQSVLAAGGTIHVENTADGLAMMDGACRYTFERQACTFKRPAGGDCVQDEVKYAVDEVTLQAGLSGLVSMVYRLSRSDMDRVCTDVTEARLVRGASAAERCVFGGRWTSAITAWHDPGPVTLEVDSTMCTFTAPGFSDQARCHLTGHGLTVETQADGWEATGCKAGQTGTYNVSFATGCAGLVLEAENDACDRRRSAFDFLFLTHR